MRYRKQQAARWLQAGVAALTALAAMLPVGPAAHAQTTGHVPPTQPAASSVEASMLAGKLRFNLPAGFARTALPPSDEFGTGAVYLNPRQHQMAMVTESPIAAGLRVGDDDPVFLDAALAAHLIELDKPTPNYRPLGTTSFSIKGLGLRRTDGKTSFFDRPVYSTSLIAGSGATLATVIIITPVDDHAGHQALVASVLDSIAASR